MNPINTPFAINTEKAEIILKEILENHKSKYVVIDCNWLKAIIFEFIRIIVVWLNKNNIKFKFINKWRLEKKIQAIIEEQSNF